MNRFLGILLPAIMLLNACQSVSMTTPETPSSEIPAPQVSAPSQVQNPYAPQEADAGLQRAGVFINSADLLAKETYPPRLMLTMSGNLPSPCHQLRVDIAPPSANGRIDIEVYSVYNRQKICVQVLKDFNISIEMGVYPKGHYQIYINGDYLGDFAF